MQEMPTIKNRREFMKDGLRVVLSGGLAFMGLFLGWRGNSDFGKESSCSIALPCRNCSKLFGCEQPRAIATKQDTTDSREQPLLKVMDPK